MLNLFKGTGLDVLREVQSLEPDTVFIVLTQPDAHFNLSTRYASRGYSGTGFSLRRTREDIGSYLGLNDRNRQPRFE
jgi:hypothetical protein